MRCTRRSRDRAFVGVTLGALGALAALASCSDDAHRDFAVPADDAATETAVSLPPATTSDGGSDAAPPVVYPTTPRSVTCGAGPCATALSGLGVNENTLCALLSSGKVACWGVDSFGSMGRTVDAGGTFPYALPGFVDGIDDATALAGTCVLRPGGVEQCWGYGGGVWSTPPVTALPVDTATGTCAVTGPTAWTCRELVAGVDGGPPTYLNTTQTLPAGARPITKLAVFDSYDGRNTFVLQDNGVLQSAGAPSFLGRASSLSTGDPYLGEIPLPMVSDFDIGQSACAVAGGDLYCWGRFEVDSAGNVVDRTPARIVFPEPVVRVATGRRTSRPELDEPVIRVCASVSSGDVYCLGINRQGQVGDGTRALASVPTRVKGLPAPAVSLRITMFNTCALLENGHVFCWGAGGSALNGVLPGADALVPEEVKLP